MEQLLLIDDDAELGEMLAEYLRLEGFAVDQALDGNEGVERAISGGPMFVVLDVMLPGLGGFEVLRRIRAASHVPVLMLTARQEEIDRILGLELGADDYLSKPFNPRELVARVRAVLRRVQAQDAPMQSAQTAGREQLIVGDLVLDVSARAVRRAGESITLTGTEFDILQILLRTPGRVVTREHLVKTVLDRRLMPGDRSIDTHIGNLRRKLDAYPDGAERVKALRGVGYLYALHSQDGARDEKPAAK
jgi:DNA-binding response OmpR family regulator